jgi:hypothetical protein
MGQLQSHIGLTASSYMGKYLSIYSYIRKPLLIFDFATAPLWKFDFLFYQCTIYAIHTVRAYCIGVIRDETIWQKNCSNVRYFNSRKEELNIEYGYKTRMCYISQSDVWLCTEVQIKKILRMKLSLTWGWSQALHGSYCSGFYKAGSDLSLQLGGQGRRFSMTLQAARPARHSTEQIITPPVASTSLQQLGRAGRRVGSLLYGPRPLWLC